MEIYVAFVFLVYISRNILVQAQGANIALGKPADQKDTLGPAYTADIAVNGENNNCGIVFTHTATYNNSWWTVDLQRFVSSPTVKVFPRSNYYDTYRVLLGNFTWRSSTYKTCAEKRIYSPSEEFVCQGMTGRFVAVQRLTTTQPLSLCEVEVRGDIVERNRALGQATNQSTTYVSPPNDYGSHTAVNGRRSGPFTHTMNDNPKWWLVDLQGQILIYKFIITPRFCLPGYHGPQCNKTCPANCEGPCDEETGNCLRCPRGRWGETCNQTCSAYCATCDQRSGSCVLCVTGFWGPQCEQCGSCSGGTCDQSNGDCPGSCIRGHYGRKCDHACPLNCFQSACQKENGVCLSCKEGFWGTNCNGQCGNCVSDICNQTDASCPSACQNGFYGRVCNSSCPANCGGNICLKQNGSCMTCKQGLWGSHCTSQCWKCMNDTCNKNTGRCDQCLPGTWGSDFCERNCSNSCMMESGRSCNRTTGRCDECAVLFWGAQCDRQCLHCSDFPCDRQTGHCKSCRLGFHGKLCDKICPANCSVCDQDTALCQSCTHGTHGEYCDKPCPSSCGGNKHCDKVTSRCFECPAGYHGDHCTRTCPVSCSNNGSCFQGNGSCVACPALRYGATCQETCGQGCMRGICDRDNGFCICLHDYELPKCQRRKNASRLNVAAVRGGLGAVILILILLFVIMVIWLRTGRKLPCIETPQHFQNKGSYQDGLKAVDIPTVYEELDHIEPSGNAAGFTDGNRGGKSDAYTNLTADYCELSPNKNHLQQHEYLALNVHKGSSIYQNQPEGGQLKRQENKKYEEIVNKRNIAQ